MLDYCDAFFSGLSAFQPSNLEVDFNQQLLERSCKFAFDLSPLNMLCP